MSWKDQKDPSNRELYDEIVKLRDIITRISKGYPRPTTFIRNLGFFFLRGVMMGLGWLMAFVVLIPILVLILRLFAPAPVVGDIVGGMVDRIMEFQNSVDLPVQ